MCPGRTGGVNPSDSSGPARVRVLMMEGDAMRTKLLKDKRDWLTLVALVIGYAALGAYAAIQF